MTHTFLLPYDMEGKMMANINPASMVLEWSQYRLMTAAEIRRIPADVGCVYKIAQSTSADDKVHVFYVGQGDRGA